MNRMFRRILGIRSPAEECGTVMRHFTQCVIEGVRNPGPPNPEAMAEMFAHVEGVAHRSFSTLYDDEI